MPKRKQQKQKQKQKQKQSQVNKISIHIGDKGSKNKRATSKPRRTSSEAKKPVIVHVHGSSAMSLPGQSSIIHQIPTPSIYETVKNAETVSPDRVELINHRAAVYMRAANKRAENHRAEKTYQNTGAFQNLVSEENSRAFTSPVNRFDFELTEPHTGHGPHMVGEYYMAGRDRRRETLFPLNPDELPVEDAALQMQYEENRRRYDEISARFPGWSGDYSNAVGSSASLPAPLFSESDSLQIKGFTPTPPESLPEASKAIQTSVAASHSINQAVGGGISHAEGLHAEKVKNPARARLVVEDELGTQKARYVYEVQHALKGIKDEKGKKIKTSGITSENFRAYEKQYPEQMKSYFENDRNVVQVENFQDPTKGGKKDKRIHAKKLG